MKEEEKAQPLASADVAKPLGGAAAANLYDLPPVMKQRTGGGFDMGGFDMKPGAGSFDPYAGSIGKTAQKEEGKSLKDMMREKRMVTEKAIEGKQPPPGQAQSSSVQETIEARKARLRAQRDLMAQLKKDKLEKELKEFNSKTTTKHDLHRELLEMDKNIKKKEVVA